MRTVWLSLLLAFAGCSRQHPGDAPHLRAGSDACARCGMVVSDERFAAGYVSDRGESVIFDDLGELLAALDERPELRARAWVRHLDGEGWIPLKSATLERIAGSGTPMGTGWVAFSDEAAAKAFRLARNHD